MSLSYLLILYDPSRVYVRDLHGEHPSLSSDVVNERSLTSLVSPLIEFLLSNCTLQELTISSHATTSYNNLPVQDVEAIVQLVEVAANSTSLKKLSFDSRLFSNVQPHIPEQYHVILHGWEPA